MTTTNKVLKQSLAVQDAWQQHTVAQRSELLLAWAQLLSQRDQSYHECAAMIRFQCQQALALIANEHELQGPTGESNQLYTAGRGCFLLVTDETASNEALVGLMAAALVAGNTVICCAANSPVDELLSDLLRAGCPDRVAQPLAYTLGPQLAQNSLVAGIALAGTKQNCIHYNQLAAERDGQLAQFVYEVDMRNLSQLSEPTLCLRFITERTRTINITAVGGNASLLELGSGE
ncbi:delta 1-pyrroline-5-carboxylate dehydrogenase [Agarivorans sp. B2Z047]|uniref:delta 1-pyrroline-5-carboxylate dehydrogenase n=1 Tax=Agarivorans sp. B2Z047 TaxID=2652721 RepID=UPI00128D3295|nr:delta 1-pyrroline-5-carboxylate dehydrogenase [Agarivorans sp. B2Z047]MPW27522.1 delta 1-pyrroline-5-carboxylate dehydrogenase [Agarivorans sp. B2Z047]UQN44637.1 hypothetical protein LQZ07_09275 [Agarivorans sp. B2Z047]